MVEPQQQQLAQQALEQAVLEEVRRIAAEELEWTRPVQPTDDLLKDLQLDSLGLTVLAVGLENRFRVRLTEEDSAGILTVQDLMRLVATRSAESARSEEAAS